HEGCNVCHTKGPTQIVAAGQLTLQRGVPLSQRRARRRHASLVARRFVALGEQFLHEWRDLFHHRRIGLVLQLPAARAYHSVGGEERRLWIPVFEILVDDCRVVHRRLPVDEYRYLAAWTHGQELRRLGLPEGLAAPRNLQRVVLETFLGERDAHLGAERAEDSGPQLHTMTSCWTLLIDEARSMPVRSAIQGFAIVFIGVARAQRGVAVSPQLGGRWQTAS